MLSFSPLSTEYKRPTGSVPQGTDVWFFAGSDEPLSHEQSIVCAIQKDGELWCEYRCVPAEDVCPADVCPVDVCRAFLFKAETVGLYFYKFKLLGADGSVSEETATYQITVFSKDYETPSWLRGALMYQIFPDRFKRSEAVPVPVMNKPWSLHESWEQLPNSGPDENGIVQNNDFFGGNLKGIAEELPYLKALGVSVIYLNPIFEAYSNHRYDTADYMRIDPLLGTEQDFTELCQAAGALGIRIILDGVFNHTGSHSIYFNKDGAYDSVGAFQSRDSKYLDWYRFSDWPGKYECWWGIDTLPGLNETNPAVEEYLISGEDSVVAHWLRAGASGFRLDVADELPDGFLDALRKRVKEIKPDACVIGEVWEDASSKIAYGKRRRYFQGQQLDTVMNYPLKDGIIGFLKTGDGGYLADVVNGLYDHYPACSFYTLMNILGTHDTERILTVLSDGVTEEQGRGALYGALLIWAFMPGSACIYYGDELGMMGGRDPMNRLCFRKDKADVNVKAMYEHVLKLRSSVNGLGALELADVQGQPGRFSFRRGQGKDSVLISVFKDSLGNWDGSVTMGDDSI